MWQINATFRQALRQNAADLHGPFGCSPATGLFFGGDRYDRSNMDLQMDENWRYMDIFLLTLNGNGYIGTFPSLLGSQSMTCPVFLTHCPISSSGLWLGTCSDMISCLIYCGKPTHKESQASLQIWVHLNPQAGWRLVPSGSTEKCYSMF